MSGQGLKVGIVGGSIAGCTVAIELLRAGCEVTLFERTGDELKDRGAGIGIPAAILETLIARDLVDADTAYFAGRGFTRLWRTPREHRYGYLAWDQPADRSRKPSGCGVSGWEHPYVRRGGVCGRLHLDRAAEAISGNFV